METINKKEVLNKLRHIKSELAGKYGLKELALFGSVSRNDFTGTSDIDIFIDLEKNTSDNFFNVAFTIEDLFHPAKVDIVTRKGLKASYFNAIKGDLIYV